MLGGSGDSKTSSTSQVILGSSEAKTQDHESNTNIGGSNWISEEDRVGAIDNNEGERSFGGNRWPRQETLALLKIRSDMDFAFRDASIKAPLWDQISRKLAELGYNRSAKKCKEKFENVYKYHKRSKEGKTGKPDGKTYKFFEQLIALENQPPSSSHHHQSLPSISQSKSQQHHAPTMVVTSTINNIPPLDVSQQNNNVTTVPSTQQPNTVNLSFPSLQTPTNPTIHQNMTNPSTFQAISADLFSNSTSSTSTSSDYEIEGRRRNRKRKWKDFFERLMTEVIEKQEELQKRFLEAIEKRENERIVREEAWRIQEMARINREREILAQERSISVAKDSAVLAFLHKISEQQNQNMSQPNPNIIIQPPASTLALTIATQLPPALPQPQPRQLSTTNVVPDNVNNGEQNELMLASPSSRWPKVEIEALIKLRTTLDAKYQENSPKGPLWEEISASMKKLGYNRNPKRCKEKWENINKYYKKVKESNKKRPEDSKTCPYFQQLEALYREKNKFENTQINQFKPAEINSIPIMVTPEQQWPPQQDNNKDSAMDPMDQNQEEDNDRDDDVDDDDYDDEDESDGNYELVANKPENDNNNGMNSATAV